MYTGILLRADTHVNYSTDLLIHREYAVSELGLGIGFDHGSGVVQYWLNFDVLSKLGAIASDGVVTPGFKTSILPITFDAAGDIKVNTDNVIFKGSATLSYDLKQITEITASIMTVYNKEIVLAPAEFMTRAPVLSSPTTTQVVVAWIAGANTSIVVEDEAGIVIGTTTETNKLLTITTQTTGNRIYAYTLDVNKNRSFRTSILIP